MIYNISYERTYAENVSTHHERAKAREKTDNDIKV